MAPTSSTAALTLAAMLALAAVSADSTRASNSTSNTSAPSEQADSAEGSGGGVRARQLFNFGPGNQFQNGPLGSGFPFGSFGGVPGFGALFNPFVNGSPGNGQFNNGNPTVGGGLGSSPFPNNPQGSGEFNGNSGGPVEPRPDQVGNQFNNGRPAFGNGQALNGNGNQFNNGRPAFGNGQALNGNGNQFSGGSGEVPPTNGNQFNNGGRPAFGNGQALNGNGNQQFGGGSGEVPPTNGNQFNNGGRPAGPVRPGGQAGPPRPVGVPPAANQPPQRPAAPTTSPLQPQQPQQRDALINPFDCGIRDEDRIIGGNLTSVMELPWMARLGYTSRRGGISYRCGGSLINHRYVLTAAHCVGDGEDPVQVRLGEWDEDSERDCSLIAGSNVCAPPVVDVPIERVIRHPQYSSDTQSPNYLKNDIALLRLRSPVTFSEAVKPICLPEQGAVQVNTPTGSKAIVAGWGKDRNRGSTGTRYLLKASVPLWSVPECTRVYQSRGVRVGPTQVCAGGTRGIDSCQGDSGGPLYRPGLVHEQPRAVQIGVVSFGLKDCATEGVPGVYTRVESHMPWVTSNLAP